MSSIAYRPEVDGLRAIAVGVVVLFHAQLGLFPGGYVGVDVFFVISGYLITSIIRRELDSGTFSLLSFYERRIRRIFPALLLVIAACLAVGAWRMTPFDYDRLGESALAAIGFHSNFYFADKAGYFMPAAETMPLLHTWSLGVEEQFYVVAPLLLMAMWRFRSLVLPVFVVLLVAALVASLWGVRHDSDTAFYLPHTRAIELMIGMALGLGLVPEIASRLLRQLLSIAGIALIAFAAIFFSSATPFPGAAALVPCLGSALVIHCAGGRPGESLVGTVLSTVPAVLLGKISYSLYLWHWPIFAFAAYEWGDIGAAGRLALVVASIGLSIVTYRWVEQPARTSRVVLTRPRVYAAGLGSAAILAGAAAAVAASDGWPGRLPPAIASIEAIGADRGERGARCEAIAKAKAVGHCELGDRNGPARILVWGDSHALALAPQFDAIGKSLGVSVLMVANGGCPPLFESGAVPGVGRDKCRRIPRKVTSVLELGTIRHVVIAARWSHYVGRPANEVVERRAGDRAASGSSTDAEKFFRASFERTLARLHSADLRITLIGPVPELPVHLPSAMTKAYLQGRTFNLTYDFAKFSSRQQMILALLAETEKLARVDVIYPDRILCPLGKCRFIDDGIPLYRDDDHLNVRGGDLLKPGLTRSLAWLK